MSLGMCGSGGGGCQDPNIPPYLYTQLNLPKWPRTPPPPQHIYPSTPPPFPEKTAGSAQVLPKIKIFTHDHDVLCCHPSQLIYLFTRPVVLQCSSDNIL